MVTSPLPSAFNFARMPRLIFGAGRFLELPRLAAALGRNLLLVTGQSSLQASGKADVLQQAFSNHGLRYFSTRVTGEPSPALVDQAVAEFGSESIHAVIAIGGGSVLDAGKAIAAMLPLRVPVIDYLEGVGNGKVHSGVKVPFIAVPTTAGTGTEATKNASLRIVADNGFKKSLRHDNFVPDLAVVDPELSLTCPPHITAACGMDALAQLLESFVSPQASPLTDALAISGLHSIKNNLLPACGEGAGSLSVRAGMAYAAFLSGVTLANAGLGIVHSLSSTLGGVADIPHGVICGTLLAAGTRKNVERLESLGSEGEPAWNKHAQAGRILSGRPDLNPREASDTLLQILEAWTEQLQITRLGAFGLSPERVDKIAAATPLRNNPAPLSEGDIRAILLSRI